MCGAACVIYGLIFFVVLRIFKTSNSKKRAVISLITGGVLILMNTIAIVFDYFYYGKAYLGIYTQFLAFPFMAILFTIVVTLVFSIIGHSAHQQLHNIHEEYREMNEKKIKEEAKRVTIKDEDNYLYLALKYNGEYLLNEIEKDGALIYGGLSVKFPRKEYFHDELIRDTLKLMKIDYEDYNLRGTLLEKREENKNRKYFVYLVEVNEIPEGLGKMVTVSPYVLYEYNMSKINKEILFHLVLNERFDIEV